MKILKMSLLTLLIAGGVACNNDDEDNNNNTATTEEKVEGEWEMQEYEGEAESQDTSNQSSQTFSGSNFSGSVVFEADNTFQSDLSFDLGFVIQMGGTTMDTITTTVNDLQGTGTWDVENNSTLSIITAGDTASMEIVSLTSSEMVLKQAYEQASAGATYVGESRITFSKK